MWIPKGAALIRGWHLFGTRCLLEKIRYFKLINNFFARLTFEELRANNNCKVRTVCNRWSEKYAEFFWANGYIHQTYIVVDTEQKNEVFTKVRNKLKRPKTTSSDVKQSKTT